MLLSLLLAEEVDDDVELELTDEAITVRLTDVCDTASPQKFHWAGRVRTTHATRKVTMQALSARDGGVCFMKSF
jgi:hypothetical protein